MIESHCRECGARVWRAVNERAGLESVEYFSEAQVFSMRVLDGGLPRVVPVHGVYQKHVCARRMTILNRDVRRDKLGRNRKPITARAVRARMRRNPDTPQNRPESVK